MKRNGMYTNEWGTKSWWLNDKLHREDGPAIERVNGTKRWFVNGKIHREDGPAVIRASGTKEWHVNGKKHRLDGPAVEWANGDNAWYVNGKYYASFDHWLEAINVSDEQKMFLKLKWA